MYVESLIEGFKRDYEGYSTSNSKDNDSESMLPKSLNHLRLLSSLKNSTSVLNQIVESDIHGMLLHLLGRDFDARLRLEAAWLLNNFLTVDSSIITRLIANSTHLLLNAFVGLFDEEDPALSEIVSSYLPLHPSSY